MGSRAFSPVRKEGEEKRGGGFSGSDRRTEPNPGIERRKALVDLVSEVRAVNPDVMRRTPQLIRTAAFEHPRYVLLLESGNRAAGDGVNDVLRL